MDIAIGDNLRALAHHAQHHQIRLLGVNLLPRAHGRSNHHRFARGNLRFRLRGGAVCFGGCRSGFVCGFAGLRGTGVFRLPGICRSRVIRLVFRLPIGFFAIVQPQQTRRFRQRRPIFLGMLQRHHAPIARRKQSHQRRPIQLIRPFQMRGIQNKRHLGKLGILRRFFVQQRGNLRQIRRKQTQR